MDVPAVHLPSETVRSADVRVEGDRVLVFFDGRLAADLPYDAAKRIGRAILAQALAAEEFANRQELAADQALLLRAGVPVLLSKRSDIQEEAAKSAEWDPTLRKALPENRIGENGLGYPNVRRHDDA